MANDSNMPKSGIVLQSDSYGRNALHVACSVPSTGILEIVQYLFYTKVDEIKSVRKEYLKRLQEVDTEPCMYHYYCSVNTHLLIILIQVRKF